MEALGAATDTLLGYIEERTNSRRDLLLGVSASKWKAKCALKDKLMKLISQKHERKERFDDLGLVEQNRRNDIYKLNSKIYALEEFVDSSKKIQAEIVDKFRSGAPYQQCANELVALYSDPFYRKTELSDTLESMATVQSRDSEGSASAQPGVDAEETPLVADRSTVDEQGEGSPVGRSPALKVMSKLRLGGEAGADSFDAAMRK
eukprot:28236_1